MNKLEVDNFFKKKAIFFSLDEKTINLTKKIYFLFISKQTFSNNEITDSSEIFINIISLLICLVIAVKFNENRGKLSSDYMRLLFFNDVLDFNQINFLERKILKLINWEIPFLKKK